MGQKLSLWPPSFEGAIFDFDGTIADTAWVWKRVDGEFLGARGIEYTTEYARILSVLGFEKGARYTIDTYGLDETEEDICAEWTRMSRRLYQKEVCLRPGVEDYINALREQGIPVAIATTNEPEVLGSLEQVDIDGLFDACVHGRDVGTTKDEPDIYLEAARRMGVEPSGCVVFEDIVPGTLSAARAGFATCGVDAGDLSQDVAGLRAVCDHWLEGWEGLV